MQEERQKAYAIFSRLAARASRSPTFVGAALRRPAVDAFPQNVCYSDSTFSETHLYHAKFEGHSRLLNHRKSDSYAAPVAQRRSAGARISDPQHYAHGAIYRASLRPLRWVLEGLTHRGPYTRRALRTPHARYSALPTLSTTPSTQASPPGRRQIGGRPASIGSEGRRPPVGRARKKRKLIQVPSPETWSETISGNEEREVGWPVFGPPPSKNYRRRTDQM